MGEQIDRDPKQPRKGPLRCCVVRRSALESSCERLGREIVGDRRADAAAQVAVDRPVVAVEDDREDLRLRHGSSEETTIRQLALVHPYVFPGEAKSVHVSSTS